MENRLKKSPQLIRIISYIPCPNENRNSVWVRWVAPLNGARATSLRINTMIKKSLLFRFRCISLFSVLPPIDIGNVSNSSRNSDTLNWSVKVKRDFSVLIEGFNPKVSVSLPRDAKGKRVGLKVTNDGEVIYDKRFSDIFSNGQSSRATDTCGNNNMYSPMDQFESHIPFINNILDFFDLGMGFANFIFIGVILCCFGLLVNWVFKRIRNLYTRIKNYTINNFVFNHYSILFFVLFYIACFNKINRFRIFLLIKAIIFNVRKMITSTKGEDFQVSFRFSAFPWILAGDYNDFISEISNIFKGDFNWTSISVNPCFKWILILFFLSITCISIKSGFNYCVIYSRVDIKKVSWRYIWLIKLGDIAFSILCIGLPAYGVIYIIKLVFNLDIYDLNEIKLNFNLNNAIVFIAFMRINITILNLIIKRITDKRIKIWEYFPMVINVTIVVYVILPIPPVYILVSKKMGWIRITKYNVSYVMWISELSSEVYNKFLKLGWEWLIGYLRRIFSSPAIDSIMSKGGGGARLKILKILGKMAVVPPLANPDLNAASPQGNTLNQGISNTIPILRNETYFKGITLLEREDKLKREGLSHFDELNQSVLSESFKTEMKMKWYKENILKNCNSIINSISEYVDSDEEEGYMVPTPRLKMNVIRGNGSTSYENIFPSIADKFLEIWDNALGLSKFVEDIDVDLPPLLKGIESIANEDFNEWVKAVERDHSAQASPHYQDLNRLNTNINNLKETTINSVIEVVLIPDDNIDPDTKFRIAQELDQNFNNLQYNIVQYMVHSNRYTINKLPYTTSTSDSLFSTGSIFSNDMGTHRGTVINRNPTAWANNVVGTRSHVRFITPVMDEVNRRNPRLRSHVPPVLDEIRKLGADPRRQN